MGLIKGAKLRGWQIQAADMFRNLESLDVMCIKSPRQVGKSFFIIQCLLYTALNKEKTTSIVLEPTNKQNANIFTEIAKCISASPLVTKLNNSSLEIEFINKSRIIFLSGEQGDSLRGYHANGILVVDEANYIKESVWGLVLPYVNVSKCPILMVSTPRFRNTYFYKSCVKGLNNADHFKYLDVNKLDKSFFINDEQLAMMKNTLSPALFKSEYLGEWLDDNEGVFGDFNKCINNNALGDPCYVGIDWSTTGEDSTVMTVMNENREVVYIWADNKMKPMERVDFIANFINSNLYIKTVVPETNSMGAVYIDALKDKLNKKNLIKPFTTTNSSKKQIIENLIKGFADNDCHIPSDENLTYQLSIFEMKKLKDNNYTYQAKDNLHDDYVMSLAFCYSAANKKSGNYSISVI